MTTTSAELSTFPSAEMKKNMGTLVILVAVLDVLMMVFSAYRMGAPFSETSLVITEIFGFILFALSLVMSSMVLASFYGQGKGSQRWLSSRFFWIGFALLHAVLTGVSLMGMFVSILLSVYLGWWGLALIVFPLLAVMSAVCIGVYMTVAVRASALVVERDGQPAMVRLVAWDTLMLAFWVRIAMVAMSMSYATNIGWLVSEIVVVLLLKGSLLMSSIAAWSFSPSQCLSVDRRGFWMCFALLHTVLAVLKVAATVAFIVFAALTVRGVWFATLFALSVLLIIGLVGTWVYTHAAVIGWRAVGERKRKSSPSVSPSDSPAVDRQHTGVSKEESSTNSHTSAMVWTVAGSDSHV